MGMGSSWFDFFLVHQFILLLLINFSCWFSFVQTQTLCHDDERSALLQFKASFTIDMSASQDPFAYPKVESWGSLERNPQSSNCCSWDGVECNNDSGHVISLDLASSYLHGSIDSNSSLFQLVHLQRLDLSDNNFSYSQVPSRLGHDLTSLTYLNLSMSSFSGHIPSEVSFLSKLSMLDLHMPYSLANLTQLLVLDLSQNQISGEIPCLLANLTQLTKLRLGYNQITGEIPSCLVQLTQLTLLDLRFNNIQGAIPRSVFQLKSLEYIFLNSNNLSGYLEFDEISKLQNLRGLRLSLNKLSVQIKTGFRAIPPKLNLLELSSCNLTEFPEFLKYTSELMHLDLSDNNLRGQIPKWLWNSTSETLLFLNLSHNHLTGYEENPVIIPWHRLSSLVLDSNMFRGSLPIPASSMAVYSVSNNEYAGEIPEKFCNTGTLTILDLSNNKLKGMIPKCFQNLGALQILKLRNNSFHGDIPQICLNTSMELAAIDLSYNQLQGKLPRSIARCPQLMFLNLGNNQIIDTFPSWLGTLQQLKVLILQSNAFHGTIGKPASSHEFPELSIVDLSSNDFSGSLPSDYIENWNAMKSVDVNEQIYIQSAIIFGMYPDIFHYDYPITVFSKGVELKYMKTPYLLRLIDLSSNKFEGEIPVIIGNLRALLLLNLSNNTLTGPIPSSLWNLTALESLDLSQNQLSGKIPTNLAQLTFLSYFNVSHNGLYGAIPQSPQFDTFQEDMYQGNPGLCGKPLSKKCGDSESATPQTTLEEDEDSGFQIELDWFVVLPGVITGLIVGVVGGNFWTAKKHDWFVDTFNRRRRLAKRTQKRREQRPWSY